MQSLDSDTVYNHFFPKKDMMFPWPGFPPFFVAAPLAVGAAVCILGFFAAGSSSENSSQAGSSLVTGELVSLTLSVASSTGFTYQDIPHRP